MGESTTGLLHQVNSIAEQINRVALPLTVVFCAIMTYQMVQKGNMEAAFPYFAGGWYIAFDFVRHEAERRSES